MQHGLPLLSSLMLLLLACDGQYVLAYQRDNGDAGGAAGSVSVDGDAGDVGSDGSPGGAAGAAGAAGASTTDIRISPVSLPDARLNRAYLAKLSAEGGVGPYRFALEAGALPSGVTLEEDGTLSGSPAAVGAFDFTVHVSDEENGEATAPLQLQVTRSRWLASETFPASSSTQTLLSLVDLHNSAADPVVIESQTVTSARFSPDGDWLMYRSFRTAEHYDWYVVNVGGEAPTERELLISDGEPLLCEWSPDSSKLACMKELGVGEGAAHELVYFDTSSSAIGPETSLGAMADNVVFLDADTLVYGDVSGELTRIDWEGSAPQPAVALGMGDGTIGAVAPDGRRAIVAHPGMSHELVDFETRERGGLSADPMLVSKTFEIALVHQPAADGVGPGTRRYYSISGVETTLVAETPLAAYPAPLPNQQLVGRTVAFAKGQRAFVAQIGDNFVSELEVPGAYEGMQLFRLDPTGRWLYIATATYEDGQLVHSAAKHWLSYIDATGFPGVVQLIAEGYVEKGSSFSPDGKKLFVLGASSESDTPMAAQIFDLSEPQAVQTHTLDLPLLGGFGELSWSPDSSYASLIGATPTERALLVIDALAPDSPYRKIVACSSNPAPLPGCPNVATFQP